MSRAQHRSKPRKRTQHARQQGPATHLVFFELEDISEPEAAQRLLSRIGLPKSPMLVAEDLPVLAALASPGPVDDCTLVSEGGRVLGMLYGTDCALSRSVHRSVGRALPAAFVARCDRRAAGGVFRVLDINEVRAH